MDYNGRSLVHDRRFDRDCEDLFGSLARADEMLAATVFEIAHGLVSGVSVANGMHAYEVAGICVLLVEDGPNLTLRACVALCEVGQIAA